MLRPPRGALGEGHGRLPFEADPAGGGESAATSAVGRLGAEPLAAPGAPGRCQNRGKRPQRLPLASYRWPPTGVLFTGVPAADARVASRSSRRSSRAWMAAGVSWRDCLRARWAAWVGG